MAIAITAQTTFRPSGASAATTSSLALSSGCTKLVVGVCQTSAIASNPFISVTYNGVPLTLSVTSAGASRQVAIYYLDNPPTGSSFNLVVTMTSGSSTMVIGCLEMTGTGTGMGITGKANGATNPLNITLTTTVANSMLLNIFASLSLTPASSGGPEITQWNFSDSPGGNGQGAGSTLQTTTIGSYTMGWTRTSASTADAEAMAEIPPAGSSIIALNNQLIFNSTATNPFTVGTGTNRLLVVGVADGGAAVTAVTWNGTALTKASIATTNYSPSIWYLNAPASGTFNVVITTSSGSYNGFIMDFTGADQTSSVIDGSVKSDPSPAVSDTLNVVTTKPNTFIVDCLFVNNSATMTPGASQTALSNAVGTGASSKYNTQGSAGTYPMVWTFGSSQFASHIAVGFASVPQSVSSGNFFLLMT